MTAAASTSCWFPSLTSREGGGGTQTRLTRFLFDVGAPAAGTGAGNDKGTPGLSARKIEGQPRLRAPITGKPARKDVKVSDEALPPGIEGMGGCGTSPAVRR